MGNQFDPSHFEKYIHANIDGKAFWQNYGKEVSLTQTIAGNTVPNLLGCSSYLYKMSDALSTLKEYSAGMSDFFSQKFGGDPSLTDMGDAALSGFGGAGDATNIQTVANWCNNIESSAHFKALSDDDKTSLKDAISKIKDGLYGNGTLKGFSYDADLKAINNPNGTTGNAAASARMQQCNSALSQFRAVFTGINQKQTAMLKNYTQMQTSILDMLNDFLKGITSVSKQVITNSKTS